jgi:hypothetical protein
LKLGLPLDVQRSVSGIRTLGRLLSLQKPNLLLEAFETWRSALLENPVHDPEADGEAFLRRFFLLNMELDSWDILSES